MESACYSYLEMMQCPVPEMMHSAYASLPVPVMVAHVADASDDVTCRDPLNVHREGGYLWAALRSQSGTSLSAVDSMLCILGQPLFVEDNPITLQVIYNWQYFFG